MTNYLDPLVAGATDAAGAADEDDERVRGERGASAVAKSQPIQARVRGWLATALFVGLAAAFIVAWALHAPTSRSAKAVQVATATPAIEAESSAPPLGPLPQTSPSPPPPASPSVVESVMGPPPPLPQMGSGSGGAAPGAGTDPTTGQAFNGNSPNAPGAPLNPWQRRLESPVMIQHSGAPNAAAALPVMDGAAAGGGPPMARPVATTAGLAASLQPTATPAVRARMLPTRRWLLPKGAFVDCTLETAIDSTLAGFTTCVTAVDILGADGTVVLLERGTKLVGEARADVRPGQSRVFVLWSEARTPTGVVADLASPGTDSLGRAGVQGAVDTHFADRFGAAILISIIDGAVQAAVSHSQSGGAVVVNPQTSTEILTEILRQTISIPPTIKVAQGTRLQVLVARDVDFREVYELKPRT